jgi:hypothetical protein
MKFLIKDFYFTDFVNLPLDIYYETIIIYLEAIMKQIVGIVIVSVLAISLSFGRVVTSNVKEYPKLTGDEVIPCTGGVLYLGGRQSPGDIIGFTWRDW